MAPESSRKKILALPGSTRSNSSNESILQFIGNIYRDRIDLQIYQQLANLPHFNPDLTGDAVPKVVTELYQLIENADGVIICTPEYVFALPGAIKNALEWTVPTTLFSDKPAAFIVASGLGEKTFESLTLIMKTLGAKMGEHTRLLIQGARSKLNQGQLVDEQVKKEIEMLVGSFLNTIS